MTNATTKIDNIRFILTMDPERRIIRDGAIVVEGSKITRVGKAADLKGVAADKVIDGSEMVATPGFINGHLHISYAHATRGIFPDTLAPVDYLTNVFKLALQMSPEEEYHTSLLALTECLKYGTTTVVDPGTTRNPGDCMKAYEESGARVIIGASVTDLPNAINVPLIGLREAEQLMESTVKEFDGALDGRVRAWTMPADVGSSSKEMLQAAKRIADENGTWMTIHCVNSPDAVQGHLGNFGRRPIEWLEEIGVLGPNLLLAHVVGLNESEVECVARTNTKMVMCPTAAVKMGNGTTVRGKLPEMIERGVTVGLGTDSGNNSCIAEVMRSMYLAAVLYKDGRESTSMVPAEKALEMATIDGARAVGLESDIGSLEAGKKADIVLFDTRRPEWRTLFNPVNSLVYNADGRSVHTVMVDGRVVVEGQKPTFVDEWELMEKMQAIGADMLERTGTSFPQSWPIV